MKLKTELLDERGIGRTLTRIAHEIIEKNKGADGIVILGVKRRGVFLADRVADLIEKFEGVKVPIGTVDITLYRDDLSELAEQPKLNSNSLGVDIIGKTIILIDDVVYTGRTVRAAIDAIIDHGRPEMIQLAVLVDRGHREIPIRPDYIGKNIPTSHKEIVSVELKELDENDSIKIYEL